MRDRRFAPLVGAPAEGLRHLVLERLLQDQPRAEAADRLHGILLLADTASTSSSCARNRSLGDTLAMRAYLHRFDWPGQSGGYARLTFPRTLGRHQTASTLFLVIRAGDSATGITRA